MTKRRHLVDLDLDGNYLKNVGIEVLETLPTSHLFVGRIVSVDNKLYQCVLYDNNLSWEQLGKGGEASIGPQGATGTQGASGAQGKAGANGTNGANGSQGATGAQGKAGANGTNGTNGSQGTQGVQGKQGVQGTEGKSIQGANGKSVQGANGASIQGTQGVQGKTGASVQGAKGDSIQGTKGASVQGAKGDSIQGTKGTSIQGSQGVQGKNGASVQGANGASIQGSQGKNGASVQGAEGKTVQGATGSLYVGQLDRTTLTSTQWATYITNGNTEPWNNTSSLSGRIGDLFTVTGIATDTYDTYVSIRQATSNFTSSTSPIQNKCIGGFITKRGVQGKTGSTVQGSQGKSGSNGLGTQGTQGVQGVQGKQGVQGNVGKSIQGNDGKSVQGKTGDTGPSAWAVSTGNSTSITINVSNPERKYYAYKVSGTTNVTLSGTTQTGVEQMLCILNSNASTAIKVNFPANCYITNPVISIPPLCAVEFSIVYIAAPFTRNVVTCSGILNPS